jgi:ferrous iron transport protein B
VGIVTAIVLGMVLKGTLFKIKEKSTFVMELPPYRMPTLRGIWFHMWERTRAFVRKAWTVIMAVLIVLWVMLSIPAGGQGAFADTDVNNSLFASVSGAIAPTLNPLGFGTWEASGSLVTGFVAKEIVFSTMAQIYDVEEVEPTALMSAVGESFETSSGGHGALAALAFMIFVLIYTPCMVAVERQELGNRWMWTSLDGQLVLAWLITFVVFQGGKLLGLAKIELLSSGVFGLNKNPSPEREIKGV